jgi:hypothetical protein
MSYGKATINLVRTGQSLGTKKIKVLKINAVTGQKTSATQKAKDSMQPCDELAAVFGVCPKPSIKRSKM